MSGPGGPRSSRARNGWRKALGVAPDGPLSSAPPMTSSLPSLAAPWRIGVDVGGTFTDMVLRDAAGAVRIFKAPSVPADPSEGVLGVLRLAAQQLDLPLSALLRDCALFVHGSTVATNTILEKKGAKVGMLTTEGFRDSLGDPPRHPREPVGPPRAVPRGAGAALPAPAGARPHRRRRKRARAAGRRGRRRGGQGVRRRGRRVGRRLPVQLLPRRRARARGRRAARRKLGRQMDLAVERGHADHGRVRARLDRRGQRLYRAQGDELPAAPSTSSCASSACRARCCCCRATAARCRSTRSRARPVMLVLSGPAAGVGALKGCAAPGEQPNLISMEIGGTSLRRHGDGQGRGAGDRRAHDRRLSPHHAVGRDPHRRRGRRHDRLGRRCGPAACRAARRRRAARARRLRAGRREPDRDRRAARARPPAPRPAGRRRRQPRRQAGAPGDRDQARPARSASRSRMRRRA